MNNSIIACKLCITDERSRMTTKHLFNTQEELNDHLESVHHKPIIHEGETEDDAIKRFLKKYPEAKNCLICKAAGSKWAKK